MIPFELVKSLKVIKQYIQNYVQNDLAHNNLQ